MTNDMLELDFFDLGLLDYDPTTCWQTSDGRIIPFKEMTDSHLNNAIHYFRNGYFQKVKRLREERNRRIKWFKTIRVLWHKLRGT